MKKRVLSGMRTTHKLHIGNYFGALKNWVKLQETYECFYGAMNWHALTDGYKNPEVFEKYNHDIISDWIAFGIDPEKSVVYIQSEIPELMDLNMILTMLTPMSWLDRVTTWKDAEEDLKAKDAHNLGRFSYPVLQTADILLFKGNLVPVGQDQIPHIELSREIVRRLNHLYKMKMPEPGHLLTETPLVMGSDGRKMSKSYGNVVPLLAEPNEVDKLTKGMVTDPARVRRTDPGNPDVCPVFSYHKLFTGEQERSEIDTECRKAGIGCGDCKLKLSKNISEFMKVPLQRKKDLLNNPKELDSIIQAGCVKARKVAGETMAEIRDGLGWSK